MRIELQPPYSNDWRLGYLVVNKEPRRNVILYNNTNSRSTVSYARYLMSVHLGRYLEDHEVVDHINNNKMDDRIDNFQILTGAENSRKSAKPAATTELECPVCRSMFTIHNRHLPFRNNPTCSRKCGSIKSRWK